MIKITNGVNVFEVTQGAFDCIYSKQGYKPYEDSEKKNRESKSANEAKLALSAEEMFCKEIIEKPISEWTKEEVKKFADIKGVDITGTKNANEAKARIKAFISE